MLVSTVVSFLASSTIAFSKMRQRLDIDHSSSAFGLNPTRPTNISYTVGDRSMVEPMNIYIIWYGLWADESKSIVTDFLSGLDQSGFWSIATKYYQQVNTTNGVSQIQHVTNTITIKGQVDDHYSLGTSLNNASDYNANDLDFIIQNHISAGRLPSDTNGFYVVLGDEQTIEGNSCSQYCGYHGSIKSDQMVGETYPGVIYNVTEANYVYTWVGNAAACGPNAIAGCGGKYITPNGNAAIDAMLSPLAHEIAEASSNPDVYSGAQGWLNSNGENGDNCAYIFGSSRHYDLEGGYYYNNEWNGRKYNIQQLWDPETQLCGPVNPADIPAQCKLLEQMFPSLYFGNDCCNSGFADCADGEIVSIDVRGTGQNGDISDIISQIIVNFPSIRELSLGSNNFTGEFPDEICFLFGLRTLSLSSLPISGSLPECLVFLNNLEVLSVHGSQLTGEIPSIIFENFAPLKEINLRENNFTGTIPDSLAAVSTVTYLDISSNPFLTGPLPSGFTGFNGQTYGPSDNSGPVVLCSLAGTDLCLSLGYSGPACGLSQCVPTVTTEVATVQATPTVTDNATPSEINTDFSIPFISSAAPATIAKN